MSYPLGSFPRFGHQETWANERRERAIANSIATRQSMARRNLMVEHEVYEMLDEYVKTMEPNSPETEAMAVEMRRRMDRIKRKHEAGQRVYFKFLGETLRYFCEITGTTSALKDLSDERLKEVTEALGQERFRGRFGLPDAANIMPMPPSPPSSWWSELSDGQKCVFVAMALIGLLTLLASL